MALADCDQLADQAVSSPRDVATMRNLSLARIVPLFVFLTCELCPQAVSQVPSNDDCDSAYVIASPTTEATLLQEDVAGATANDSEPEESCEFLAAGVSNTVWFSFSPAFCGTLSLTTFGSDYDTVLSIFQGACDDAIEIACDDDGGPLLESQLLDIAITFGTPYLIKVAEFGQAPLDQDATLVLNIFAIPMFGDLDADCAVTIHDWSSFAQTCPFGPGVQLPMADAPDCTVFDYDDDGDFDLADFAEFQVVFNPP